ncbi:helix-turn-helix domain-containing protein [Anaerocolumna chitinilytica]|uniref:Helix-turn-helix transcriptional regulator n=1 Tax=Anaerocolumna chitinilytica TaxID=1727145 RepID=A0A7I8DR27_9FIRM|nr:helix-turn-helix transcriptional regulator [Anaerocolumna chitinilytica]BCK00869.1 helix-turn-helix transcriptional regulator [Anaerocolumna chitinilytica]
MNTIGENIKRFRIQAKFTQEELATRLGKSKNVISNWERGDNKPDADTIEEICLIFNISPNQIYSWEDAAEKPLTIAAHFEGDKFTEDELEEIKQFAEFVKNRRK